MAAEAEMERDVEAARGCAQRAMEAASKILEFDRRNARALEMLERVWNRYHLRM